MAKTSKLCTMVSHYVILVCLFLLRESFADSLQKCEHAHAGGSLQFPKDFSFGVATAAYQIEGAWDRDGKAPSIWDTYTHAHPERIDDHSNGDDAAESYDRFEQDLAALKELKVDFYRFSISWSRILPNVTTAVKNEKAIEYYNKVIDSLLANNIKPMVTMFHYDMPEELNKYGGFQDKRIVDFFQSYAEFLYETFGDRVKVWITFNEPYVFCGQGYAVANYPPLVHNPGVGDYICMDNLLRAHAKAYRVYREKYFSAQQGKIGIALDTQFYFNKNGERTDKAAERALQYRVGWLAEPIYGKSGNYPAVMISDIGNNSQQEGRSSSRLPVIDAEWSEIIKGSADFLGLNYYYSLLAEMGLTGQVPSTEHDSKVTYSVDENWKRAKSYWLYCVPQGFEGVLKFVRDNYNNVEVMVTENGWSDDGQLDDIERIEYLQAHLQAMLNAINDGCNVTYYTYWSLIDNFEWKRGYTEKFGLFSVNMTSQNKDRIIKDSAKYYRNVIESRSIPTISGGLSIGNSYESYFVIVLFTYFISLLSIL